MTFNIIADLLLSYIEVPPIGTVRLDVGILEVLRCKYPQMFNGVDALVSGTCLSSPWLLV